MGPKACVWALGLALPTIAACRFDLSLPDLGPNSDADGRADARLDQGTGDGFRRDSAPKSDATSQVEALQVKVDTHTNQDTTCSVGPCCSSDPCGGGDLIWVGNNSGKHRHAYLKFDLSALAGKTFDKASLELCLESVYQSGAMLVDLARVSADWQEWALTWENAPASGAVPVSGASLSTGSEPSGNGQYVRRSLDVTKLVQAELSAPASQRFGFVIKPNASTSGQRDVTFYALERKGTMTTCGGTATGTYLRPTLLVTYH